MVLIDIEFTIIQWKIFNFCKVVGKQINHKAVLICWKQSIKLFIVFSLISVSTIFSFKFK